MKNFKKIFSTIILVGILSLSLSAESASNCLDKVKLHAIGKDFQFFGNAQVDLCDEENRLTKIIRAIQFIKDIDLSLPVKGSFNQNIFSEQPYLYFKKRVEKIVLEEKCKTPTWVAYVLKEDNDKAMHVCPHFYEISYLERAMSLVHEARHFDGYSHVDCIRGQFKTMPNNIACDSSYSEKGSYAIGVDFFIKVSQDPEISPVLRNKARVGASGDLVNRFNLLPGDLKDGAFLTDENHMLSFFDGVSAKKISQLSENQILVANDYMDPVLKDKQTSQVIDLTWGLSPLDRGSGDDKKTGSQFIDAAVGKNYICSLFNMGLVCQNFLDGSSATIRFSQIKPASIYSQIGAEGYSVVMITDHDGRGAILPSDFEELRNLRESQISLNQNKANILKVQDWKGGSKKIVVTQDGKLFFLEGRNWIPLLPTKSFSNLVAPVVWSSSLQAL